MKRTVAFTGIVVAAIGMEAKYQCMTRLMSMPRFVTVSTVLLILLILLFVMVSCFRVVAKRKLEANARQLFAEYIPRLDPSEQDLHIMLSVAGGRQLDGSEVFAVESDEKNKTPKGQWYRLLRKINRREKRKENISWLNH